MRPHRRGHQRVPVTRTWRLYLVLVSLVGMWLLILLRLLQVQILEQGRYKSMAKSQYSGIEVKHSLRGEILDRRLTPLATNRSAISAGIDTRLVKAPSEAARRIAPILGESYGKLLRRFVEERGFLWLGRRLEPEKIEALRQLDFRAMVFIKEHKRVYPFGMTAANLLGFTNIDNKGLSGAELKFDSELSGKDGMVYIQRDALNGEIVDISKPGIEPQDGKQLVLTIDYVYQTIVEEELRSTVEEYKALGGCVVVADPSTGEILAMASTPSFDPNRFTQFPEKSYRNKAISDLFEPGSTFKIVTMSALLENRIKRLDDIVFAENGVYRLAGRTIRDHEKYGWLSVADVLKNSSNIGTVKLGMEVGNMQLYRFARAFGFGASDGIELPGETAGLLAEPTRWSRTTPASVSIGYEVGVTALQMAMAYGAIANGGTLLQPIISLGTYDRLPREIPQPKPRVIRRVVSPATAAKIRGMLERVVSDGTGKQAAIDGLRIAGKTGTAQKPLGNGAGYSNTDYIASFAGFYPVANPEILIFVMVDTPRPIYWGGSVAAPTFRNILERILRVRADEVPPRNDEPQRQAAPRTLPSIRIPAVADRSSLAAVALLQGMGLDVRTEGEGGYVQRQTPAPGEVVGPNSRVLLTLYPGLRQQRVHVPDLVGLTLREAIAALGARGLKAVVYGSGVVTKQEPSAGSMMGSGSRAALYGRALDNSMASLLR